MSSRKLIFLSCLCVLAIFITIYLMSGEKQSGFPRFISRAIEAYKPSPLPIPAPTQTQTTQRPENYNLNRTYCDLKFSDGLMCPELYTELGGNCTYINNTKATCTDVRRLAAHNLRQGQLVIIQLLGSFDLVARKHGIKYWLTSGTLLGAVRHNGFIPWDTDADVEITLEEYEKFFRNASGDLSANVFFQNSESDPQLRPSNPEEYTRNKYKDIGLYKRSWNPRLRDRKSCYKYCIANGCKWHDGGMVDIFVAESIPKGTYPLKEVLFEGLSFPIQNNWREVLAGKYGKDFMEVPREGSKNRNVDFYTLDPLHSCEEITKKS